MMRRCFDAAGCCYALMRRYFMLSLLPVLDADADDAMSLMLMARAEALMRAARLMLLRRVDID